MGLLVANNASSTLLNQISNSATTLFVQTAQAPLFPLPANPDDYFMVVLEDLSQNPPVREIVKCTARSSNQMTVIRAQENTTAQNWSAGVTVSNRITAGTIQTLAANTTTTTQLYLGAFASAPSHTLENTVLVPGNLYFDTTLNQLQEYNGTAWTTLAPKSNSQALGTYLGTFAVPPSTMLDGSALVEGTLYYSSSIPGLQIWHNGAWTAVTNTVTATNTGDSDNPSSGNVINGNLVVTGGVSAGTNIIADEVVSAPQGSFAQLFVGGRMMVSGSDVSGTLSTQRFPDGIVMQWGTSITGGSGFTSATVTFPQAFVGNPIVVPVGFNNPGGQTVFLASVSPTSFTVTGPSNHDTQFNWIAVGLGPT